MRAQSNEFQEYQVKAAFLYHFGKFVDWPESSLNNSNFSICIVGKDPFGNSLESVMSGKTIKDKAVHIDHISNTQSLSNCQIVFLSSSEKKNLPEILGNLKNSPTLTVGDTDGFAKQGGMINFILQDNKIKFIINANAAEQAGLKISSQLLKLAVSE